MKFKERNQSILIKSALWMAAGLSLLLFIASFFNIPIPSNPLAGYLAIGRFTQRLLSVFVFILSLELFKRKRVAWFLVVLLTSISLFVHFVLHRNLFSTAIVLCQIYILTILLVFRQYFSRKGRRLSVAQALGLGAVFMVAIVCNSIYELSVLHSEGYRNVSLAKGVSALVNALLGGTSGNNLHHGFERFLIVLFWAAAFAVFFIVLRSAALKRTVTQAEKDKARELVKKYGQNPGSYLTLEDDKMLFFGKVSQGVVAYGIVRDVVVVNGDPICAPEDFDSLLTEFKLFCADGGYQCIFLSVTKQFLDRYTFHGFHHVKCGEEARFHLDELALAGGKMAKLRANINHANKAGLTTHEYKVAVQQDKGIEKEINAVSSAWLAGKKSSQLAFTIGGVGLENPMDRRYFYLRSPEGKMVAFNVYLPFAGMDGYMADVTRRLPDAPSGATEKLIYDAFVTFKQEGKHWGSMGLSPLSNIHEEGVKDSATAKVLELVYNKFNSFYGFKDLRMAKEKYSPTSWEPGYFVYSSSNITIQMAYAMVKIQNPAGITDYFKALFKKK